MHKALRIAVMVTVLLASILEISLTARLSVAAQNVVRETVAVAKPIVFHRQTELDASITYIT